MFKIIEDINESVASGFVSSGYIIREDRSEGEYRKIRDKTGKGKLLKRMKSAIRSRHKGDCDIRTVQELLGHKDIKTTMIYTHVLNRGLSGVKSPADEL